MRFFGARSTLWLRVLGIAVVAGALAAATGVSFGSEAGNAPSYSTNAPDPVSAQVIRNGASNSSGGSTNEAEMQVCFDKQVQTISGTAGGGTSSDMFVNGLELIGYGAGETGENGHWQDGVADVLSLSNGGVAGIRTATPAGGSNGYTYAATAASNPSNPNCVNVTITPTGGSSEPGVDLNGFTEVGVTEGSAMGLSGLPNTPGTVGLDPVGTPEVAPRIGATTGPQITSISKSGASPQTLTYVFDYLLDPNVVTPAAFAYYDSSGAIHLGSSATVSGNQVTVQFGANVVNDVYYEVFPSAVVTQTTANFNPGTAIGGTIASVPTLRSVAKVPGVAGAYDLTYDQCVVATGGNWDAILEDNSFYTTNASSRPSSDCTKVRITFGSVTNFADFANKVVLIADPAGAVQQNSSPNHPSTVSGAPVNEAPNMMKGYTNGPNLIGFSVDMANSTATYYFDNQYGALIRNNMSPLLANFGLLYKDGTNSLDANSLGQGATFTGPNQVTVQFNPNQMGNASNPVVAGVLGTAVEGQCSNSSCSTQTNDDCQDKPCDGDSAVQDYQFTESQSPEVSGIGIGGYVQTSTTTTSQTTTTTSRSSSTTTTTTHHGGHHKKRKCRKGKVRRHGKCVKKHRKHRRR